MEVRKLTIWLDSGDTIFRYIDNSERIIDNSEMSKVSKGESPVLTFTLVEKSLIDYKKIGTLMVHTDSVAAMSIEE